MANINGAIDNSVVKLLNKVVDYEEIINPLIEINYGGKKGDGYLGVIRTLIIVSGKKQWNLIIKTSPKSARFRQQLRVLSLYSNEIRFYDVIYPAFRKFQFHKELQTPLINVPRCYATSMEELNEGLVMQNMKDLGYKLYDRKKPMDVEHVSFVLKEYGKFHALSFALKDQNFELYKKISENLFDIYEVYVEDDKSAELFRKVCKTSRKVLDFQSDSEALKKYDEFCRNVSNYQRRTCSKYMDEYTVVTHGDCWTNNMLFLYEDNENNKKPTKICFLDWQMARTCAPACDITHFFYVCGESAAINNHKYFMDLYYDSLSTHIKKLGSNPEELYPRSVFEAHWRLCSPTALIMALFMTPLLVSDQEEIPDVVDLVENGKHIAETFNFEPKDESYKKRARDLILHFAKNNFI